MVSDHASVALRVPVCCARALRDGLRASSGKPPLLPLPDPAAGGGGGSSAAGANYVGSTGGAGGDGRLFSNFAQLVPPFKVMYKPNSVPR